MFYVMELKLAFWTSIGQYCILRLQFHVSTELGIESHPMELKLALISKSRTYSYYWSSYQNFARRWTFSHMLLIVSYIILSLLFLSFLQKWVYFIRMEWHSCVYKILELFKFFWLYIAFLKGWCWTLLFSQTKKSVCSLYDVQLMVSSKCLLELKMLSLIVS